MAARGSSVEIITKRLKIHPWSRDDATEFFRLSQDEGFVAFPITRYEQSSLESARTWIEREMILHETTGLGKLAVRQIADNQLIGMSGLTPWEWAGEPLVDLTYRLAKPWWGNGYGWETAEAVASFAFYDLGLTEITATITPDNIPSIRLATRLGMTFDRDIVLKSVATRLYRLRRHAF